MIQDDKPHVSIEDVPHPALDVIAPAAKEALSIWFFCGGLMLAYGIVLLAQGTYEHFGHQPDTVLARLEPTFWWGVVLTVFGGFYAVRFRPGKRK